MESLAVLRATFSRTGTPNILDKSQTRPFLCVTSETSDSTKLFCFKDLGLGFAVIGLLQSGWVHRGTLCERWYCLRGGRNGQAQEGDGGDGGEPARSRSLKVGQRQRLIGGIKRT